MKFDGYFIIVDKPPNHTSNEVTSFVKNMLGLKRTGHAGTLDPNVTGVLPIALGRATKLVDYISKATKVYVGVAKFNGKLSQDKLESVFKKFTGIIVQTPPKMSAVKKSPRKRRIYYIRLLEIEYKLARISGNKLDYTFVLFEAKVDAGTYIRTLCEDMGKIYNGGKMVELRRIQVGKIKESKAHTLQELSEAVWLYKNKNESKYLLGLLVLPETLIDFPAVEIKKTALKSICSGAMLSRPGLLNPNDIPDIKRGDLVKISCDGKFIGIGKALLDREKMLAKYNVVCFKMERVHKCK